MGMMLRRHFESAEKRGENITKASDLNRADKADVSKPSPAEAKQEKPKRARKTAKP